MRYIDFDGLATSFGGPVWRPIGEKIHSWSIATVDNEVVRVTLYTITQDQVIRLVQVQKSKVDVGRIVGRLTDSLRFMNGMPSPHGGGQTATPPRPWSMPIDGNVTGTSATFTGGGLRVDSLESDDPHQTNLYVAYPLEPATTADYRLIRATGVERPFDR
ncbi:MAG TPA: hypothetical protein VFR11_13775 [Micromonosporaceae bacterium]|nr:hypothetical protein [Micromonosporaceae bacterium]